MRGWLRYLVLSATLAVLMATVPVAYASSNNMTYYGGPVIHTATTYAIYWLPQGDVFEGFPGSDASYESLTTRFLTDLGGSLYYNILSQYQDNTNGAILDVSSFGGSYLDTNPYPSNTPTAQNIANEVLRAMVTNGWTGGLNHVFLIFTASGVYSSGATTEYCAYHSWTYTSGGQPVIYAYLPDLYSLTGTLGCGLEATFFGLTPNNDLWADPEINIMSHELFEAVSDPLGSGWSAATGEIGDLCAWQFGPLLNILGADVKLNGNFYRVQEEWSNHDSSCVLSYGPSSSLSLTFNVASGGASGPLKITYYSLGTSTWVVTNYQDAVKAFVDPNSQVVISSLPGTSEQWCLNTNCGSLAVQVGSGSFATTVEYYDLVAESASMSIQGGGQPAVALSYSTAPASIASSDNRQTVSIGLSTTPQTIWILRDTTMSTPPSVGTSSERWATTTNSWMGTAPFALPQITYYHQYLLTFSYTISGGGTRYTPPTVGYYQFSNFLKTPVGPSVWANAGMQYSFDNPLGGSTSSEQWLASTTLSVGPVTQSGTVNVNFYHQFSFVLSYAYANGASPTPPSITATFLGQTLTAPLPKTSVSGFLDAGTSYSVSSTLGGSTSNERWLTASAGASGSVGEPISLQLTYYHQYAITASYALTGGGSPAQPSISGVSVGNPVSIPLSQQPSQVWLDANSGYSIPGLLSGSTLTERWVSETPTTGTAASPSTIVVSYFHQFGVFFSYAITGGGNPTAPVLTVTQFGNSYIVALTTTQTSYWLDAGTAYSAANPLGGSGPTERWYAPSTLTQGTISGSTAVSLAYYHQFGLSLSYSVAGGGNPPSPNLSGVSGGTTFVQPLTQQISLFWVDANSVFSITSKLGSVSERWITNQTTNGSATSAESLVLNYQHQYYIQVVVSPAIGGSVSQTTGWYDAGSQVQLSATPSTGFSFASWASNNPSLLVSSVNSPATTITVGSPGTLTANFMPTASPSVTTSSSTVLVASATSSRTSASGSVSSSSAITSTSSSLTSFPTTTSGTTGAGGYPAIFSTVMLFAAGFVSIIVAAVLYIRLRR